MTTLPLNTIYCSDAREFVQSLPDKSVNCIVTSITYYGLRDYATGYWEGGNSSCDHIAGELRRGKGLASSPSSTRGGAKKIGEVNSIQYRARCAKCGAVRIDKQMGLENTPHEYVVNMVALFRETRRVLRDDGICWVNVGDSYWGGKGQSGASDPEYQEARHAAGASITKPQSQVAGRGKFRPTDRKSDIFKPKDLMMMPARLAIALQDDGWYLRSEIVWNKPNPMPESTVDRPTKSHEMVYLLSKSPTYFYDQDAIREGQTGNTHSRGNGTSPKELPEHDGKVKSNHSFNSSMTAYTEVPGGRNKRTVWTVATTPSDYKFCGNCQTLYQGKEQKRIKKQTIDEKTIYICPTCGCSDKWVNHFAAYPEELIEPMILAGCPAKVCAKCKSPYERITERTTTFEGGSGKAGRSSQDANANGKWQGKQYGKNIKLGPVLSVETLGWQPTCDCNADVDAGVVLDMFMGSGTTALVARRLGRHYIGCDLNGDYVTLANKRLAQSDPFQDKEVGHGLTQMSMFSEKS